MMFFRSLLIALLVFASRICLVRVYYACGHKDAKRFLIRVWGKAVRLSEAHLAKRLRCSDCEEKHAAAHAIRCAGCGEAILPGDQVCAVEPKGQLPEWARFHEPDRERVYVGRCCGDKFAYVGDWSSTGPIMPTEPADSSA